MKRKISIRNAHPRLRLDRRAIGQAVALLDEQFEILPSDLPHLSLPRVRLAALQSKIRDRKSKILGGCPPGELSLVFLTDPALAQIHGDFMDDPTATDVITFEGNSMAMASDLSAKALASAEALAQEAGEICVSADTAARYVGASLDDARGRPQGAPLQAIFSAELTLYLIHGWLHLAGYDDLQPAKKRRMRAAEARAMKLLQAANAVPPFRLV